MKTGLFINSKYLIIALLLICLSCKKKSPTDPTPEPEPTAQKKIKIRYEVSSSVPAFASNGHNNLMFTGTEGGYLFETYQGSAWKKEITIADNGASSINLHVDLVLDGDQATATGKIYINDELKVTANSTAPYYSSGHTQTQLDVKFR
ncbi:hypothetical protein ABDD95_20695 [Mucilaginibacter sp. PAMB04274]|uniref:hypothetical protein n=1 Tax=Mucilaginibacter sp. PAMB04274 TaxID=3138568 RepID=UPI0031F620F2